MSVVKSTIWQKHVFDEWVKTVLISLIVQEGDQICQVSALILSAFSFLLLILVQLWRFS